MKKIFALLLSVVMLFTLVACQKESVSVGDLSGKWVYSVSSAEKTYASITYDFGYYPWEPRYSIHATFTSWEGVEEFEGTYDVDGNQIIFNLDSGGIIKETFKLKGNKLIIDGKEFKKVN